MKNPREGNQSAVGTASNEQNRQYGDRGRASSGATSDEDGGARGSRGNQGWHKGWAKNKHRNESSGKYNGAEESSERDSNSSYGGTRWR